jgi:hypothetical protein
MFEERQSWLQLTGSTSMSTTRYAYGPSCEVSVMSCSTEIATILLKLLSLGILRIRAYSNNPIRCVIEADHIHNLPELVRNFSQSSLLYYWDVERPSFIEQVGESDCLAFETLWNDLRIHAESHEVASTH